MSPDLSAPNTRAIERARMREVFERQQATALRWRTASAAERGARIRTLLDALLARRTEFHEAFRLDFRKPEAEVELSEFLPVVEEARLALRNLHRWMRPRAVRPTLAMLGTRAWVQWQPRGRALIIAPWNYPLSLCAGPLISALAAGDPVILKPSEMTPHVAAVLARVIGESFPPEEVALFEGAEDTARALLELPFEHIFFTGSPAVGKQVMAAAAEHLASVTLELGGKSPAIVTPGADLANAAETLMWGKFLNAGQTCIAPDHVYVHAGIRDDFVARCRAVLDARYGADAEARRANADFARIVNARHAQRLVGLLDDAVQRGARVLHGGETDVAACYVAPTLLDHIPADARIQHEEIFGPLLPVLPYESLDEVAAELDARPKPLALYLWSTQRAEIDAFLARTTSGGACINHCVSHFAHGNLPFGGVNHSGLGKAHGRHGFETFSHERAVLRAPAWAPARLFQPPYAAHRLRLIRCVVDALRWLSR
ncbi:aldehyde dehydrogenase family protein [Pseudothauera nasutitermitis]|uniref:Aldehyde dehydrogenase n=1 Tax=Pseudothauera nasutitermitis TaxID=2565930 RepID=A0A4S4ARA1_9RHOO|nr:aldehyde dehydrogenase family protein [Pseudothauera nasutitermitis]THF62312.1 aldehyde dehydrogenase family protein [Pseudothauera nasutitermitis]